MVDAGNKISVFGRKSSAVFFIKEANKKEQAYQKRL